MARGTRNHFPSALLLADTTLLRQIHLLSGLLSIVALGEKPVHVPAISRK